MKRNVFGMVVFAVTVALSLGVPAWARKWKDSTGEHTIEAELVDFKDGKVRLKKENGKIIAVPIENLSKEDRDYVVLRALEKREPSPLKSKTEGVSRAESKLSPKAKPALLVAPFGAEEGRKARVAWAAYLGQPEEATNSIGMKLVLIPPGEFMMGSGEPAEELAKAFAANNAKPAWFVAEYPQHRVRITRPFYVGTCEVTVGQFRKFVEAAGYKTEAEQKGESSTWRSDFSSRQTDDHPVVNVSWNDAVEFCKWLKGKEGKGYGLPTEAQWEYGCRAGSRTRYCFGDDPGYLNEYGWYLENSDVKTHPVGQKKANALGLFDMHGNVVEWCAGWYAGYTSSSVDDPTGPATGSYCIMRGGEWSRWANECRSANRIWMPPGHWSIMGGFRVSREAD